MIINFYLNTISFKELIMRPKDLPDFDSPPLNEVVFGVQFSQPKNYQQIYARDVWALYEKTFPLVFEHPPLPPAFETFGGLEEVEMSFGLVQGPAHDRFWFVSENKEELIQFQNDRILHNWRKLDNNVYPRFENILPKFQDELTSLETYFASLGTEKLNVTQCELSYINHIEITSETEKRLDKWIKIIDSKSFDFDDFSIRFRQILKRKDGVPYARLVCECKNALNRKREPVLLLQFTVRGAPEKANIASAIKFIEQGRLQIVNYFDAITTDHAHKIWGKK